MNTNRILPLLLCCSVAMSSIAVTKTGANPESATVTRPAVDDDEAPPPLPGDDYRKSRSHKTIITVNGTNNPVIVDSIDVSNSRDQGSGAWLGLSTSEATEVLTAQLGLEPGVGLVVDYVEEGSPAAAAGLQKNDLLVRFGEHWIALPAQLKKLVQTRKEGDRAELVFYRKGKEQNATVTLGKAPATSFSMPPDSYFWNDIQGPLRNSMKALNDSFGTLKIDQEKLQQDIRKSLDRARQSMSESLRQMTNRDPATKALREAIQSLIGRDMLVENDASVIVRNNSKTAKSLVRTDDSGSIILISAPRLRLTVHDTNGKMLFDGPIETEEERAKVPADVWERAKPLVDQMQSEAANGSRK